MLKKNKHQKKIHSSGPPNNSTEPELCWEKFDTIVDPHTNRRTTLYIYGDMILHYIIYIHIHTYIHIYIYTYIIILIWYDILSYIYIYILLYWYDMTFYHIYIYIYMCIYIYVYYVKMIYKDIMMETVPSPWDDP